MTIVSQEELQFSQQRITDLQLALSSARRRLGNQPKSMAAILFSHQRQLSETRSSEQCWNLWVRHRDRIRSGRPPAQEW